MLHQHFYYSYQVKSGFFSPDPEHPVITVKGRFENKETVYVIYERKTALKSVKEIGELTSPVLETFEKYNGEWKIVTVPLRNVEFYFDRACEKLIAQQADD